MDKKNRALEKAGTVVGILLVLLALVIYGVANSMDKKDKNPSSPVTKVEQPSKVVSTSKPTAQPKETTPSPSPSPIATPEVKGVVSTTTFTEYPSDTVDSELGKPIVTNTEIMVVASKKVTLFDREAGSATLTGKQLVYTLMLTSTDNSRTLTSYMNANAFSTIKVGDMLTVTYSIYKNESGAELPLIVSIEKLE